MCRDLDHGGRRCTASSAPSRATARALGVVVMERHRLSDLIEEQATTFGFAHPAAVDVDDRDIFDRAIVWTEPTEEQRAGWFATLTKALNHVVRSVQRYVARRRAHVDAKLEIREEAGRGRAWKAECARERVRLETTLDALGVLGIEKAVLEAHTVQAAEQSDSLGDSRFWGRHAADEYYRLSVQPTLDLQAEHERLSEQARRQGKLDLWMRHAEAAKSLGELARMRVEVCNQMRIANEKAMTVEECDARLHEIDTEVEALERSLDF